MMRRGFVGSALMLAMAAGTAYGIDITRPGDTIIGFPVNYPAGEAPEKVIDNSADTKYLNFDRLNTGFTVTPSGWGVVRYLTVITANDASSRDPMSYILEGSNDGKKFTEISAGSLNTPTTRYALVTIPIEGNETEYLTYRVTFPTIRNYDGANSMQVAEIQLATDMDITSPADIVSVEYSDGSWSNPNEGANNLFDNRINTKFDVLNAQSGPSMVTVTPAIGATVVTGMAYFSANDDVWYPGRTPQFITLEGSNDSVNYVQIFTTPVVQATMNYQDQEFEFPNSTAYLHYRVTFDVPYTSTDMQVGEMQLFGTASTAAPENDTCARAATLNVGTISGSTRNATGKDMTACGAGDNLDVWYRFTASKSGLVEVSTCGSDSDTTLAVFNSCNGAAIACDDNGCGLQSIVRWEATAGATYYVRVALAANETGTFRLTLDDAAVEHNDIALPLAYNFNGMVHPDEIGMPDFPDGYRAIADRGLFLDGAAGSFDAGTVSNLENMVYTIVREPRQLDLVMLGDRNTIAGGMRQFDELPDGDNTGIQPSWLPNSDLTGPQTTDLSSLGLTLTMQSRLGVLYQITNGGGTFDMTLSFTDGSSVTVNPYAPDWFNDQSPPAAEWGLAVQRQFGVFRGAGFTDAGYLDNNLNVAEAILSVEELLNQGYGDYSGKTLSSITFANRSNDKGAYAIFAATLRDAMGGEPTCRADYNLDGVLNSQDFFDFLNAFFGNSPAADYNTDNVVNSQDFFDFLNDFFAGC